uniref:Uncharacterized protein n=1 Tax=Aegilops tauschii subsp. strangulata TaxID=200361 RepID=A0A453HVH7_AEGTS
TTARLLGLAQRHTAPAEARLVGALHPERGRPRRREADHVPGGRRPCAAETYLVTRLAFILLLSLGVGSPWICRLLAVLIYVVLLMPDFIRVGYYYFFSSQVLRSVVYGNQPRNMLDLYIPTDRSKPNPVVVFVIGGAWIIG